MAGSDPSDPFPLVLKSLWLKGRGSAQAQSLVALLHPLLAGRSLAFCFFTVLPPGLYTSLS